MIMSFLPFFTFAVCRFQREEACSRVRLQREYFFEVFDSFCYNYQSVLKPSNVLLIRSATIISLCLSPVKFYLFFSRETDRIPVSVNFAKAINCFMKKALKLCSTSNLTMVKSLQIISYRLNESTGN